MNIILIIYLLGVIISIGLNIGILMGLKHKKISLKGLIIPGIIISIASWLNVGMILGYYLAITSED